MAKLVWALLCQRVIIDQQTNFVSYVDALDSVAIPKFPIKAPPLFVSTIWQRDKEARLEMRVRAFAPGGEKLTEVEANPLEFAPHHRRARMTVGLAGFDLTGPGRYEFAVDTRDGGKWVEVQRVPFDVDLSVAAKPSSVAPAKLRA